MGLINLDEALKILQPHLSPMRRGIETAWAELQKYPDRLRLIQDTTARANMMACEMRYAALQYFGQQQDARICTLNRATLFLLQERLALRYKKLDRELLARNIPTYQAVAIAHQKADIEVDIVGPVTYLNVGYVLDRTELELERICVTCPNGDDRNFWAYDLRQSLDITKIRDLYDHRPSDDEQDAKVRGKKRNLRRGSEGEDKS